MRKAALIYNPDSGGKSAKRRAQVESAVTLLRNGGVDAELILTESKHHAGEATRRAMDAGCDTIFACGGDGTIHNVLQVVANSEVALAILPMGTANALAHDLDLPIDIIGAARAALQGKVRRIALGRVEYMNLTGSQRSRYFVLAAGVGVDAHLFYKLHSSTKQRMGMAAYYAKAWNMWFTYHMARFVAEYSENGSSEGKRAEVTELLSVRIRNFGGVVQELAPGASLDRNDMRLVLARTGSRLAYLAYVTRGLLRQRWKITGVTLAYSTRVSCNYQTASSGVSRDPRKIYVEADGELLGTLPAEIIVVPDALTLLGPAG